MHAVYVFWVRDTNDPQEAEDTVESFIEEYGDENNWFTILGSRSSTGEVRVVEEASDRWPKDTVPPFSNGQEFALKALRFELAWHQFLGKIEFNHGGFGMADGEDANVALDRERVSALLKQGIAKILLATYPNDTDEDLALYRAGKGMDWLKALRSSGAPFPWVTREHEGVFYSYRAFALGEPEAGKEDQGVMVYADIHT